MNRVVVLLAAAAIAVAAGRPAEAQDPPPPIGPFVVDLHGVVPRFGNDPTLAESRGLTEADLPGSGIGISAGAHAYFLKYRSITIGAGGGLTIGRSPMPILSGQPDPSSGLRAVTETLTSFLSELSLNFGDGSRSSFNKCAVGVKKRF